MTNEDLAHLRKFRESANILFDHSLIRDNGLKVKTQYSWNIKSGSSEERHHIDKESLESLLLRIRIFTLVDDDIHFDRIANICSRNLPSNITPPFMRNLKKRFKSRLANFNLMSLGINNKTYGSAEVIDLVFYGEYFHQDENKRDIIKLLRTHFGDDVRDVLVNALINMIDSIGYMQEVINQVEQHSANQSNQ